MSSTSDLLDNITKSLSDLHSKIDNLSASNATGVSIPDTHPSVSNFVDELKNYAVQFGKFIDELHIQTVVFDTDPSASPAQVAISVLSSNGPPPGGSPSIVKGKVTAIYDTTMEINGNVKATYPSQNPDPAMLNRHNAIVDKMWQSKIDTMTKIIDGITGALKIGSLL
jgi:hypothetical protein